MHIKTLVLCAALAPMTAMSSIVADDRMDAIKLCADKAIKDMGDTKVRITRTKKLRGGYRIKIIKMTEAGDAEQARIDCDVREGSITDFSVKS